MLEVLGSLRTPRYSKINVTVLVVECQMQKYWAHGVEISEDARRDKFCSRDPDFWRNSGNHGSLDVSRSRSVTLVGRKSSMSQISSQADSSRSRAFPLQVQAAAESSK